MATSPKAEDKRGFLTREEAATYCRMSTRSFAQAVRSGLLPAPVKFGKRIYRYRVADLERVAAAGPSPARGGQPGNR
jgi:hypothetical protein